MPLFFTVRQAHCRVIERLGKYNRVVNEGLMFKIPFIEGFKSVDSWGGIANKKGIDIELTEQLTVAEARGCQTKDNVTVMAHASVYWRIVDPKRAVYEVDRLPEAVKDVALNALRANVGTLELDTVLSERQSLNEQIALQLSETASKWGILFTRVEIREIITTDETAAAMRQQMEAERKRRAEIATAEGMARAEILIAEAQKQAFILKAEGKARAIELVTKAETDYIASLSGKISKEDAARVLIAQKYIDGFDVISKNKADKVFLPNSFPGILTLPVTDEKSQQQISQEAPEDQ